MSKRKYLIAALSCLCTLYSASTGRAIAQENTDATGIELLNPLSKFDPSSLDAFQNRPLFSPSRNVLADSLPEATVSTSDTSANLDIRLVGIVHTPTESVARIASLDDEATHSLRKGDVFRDWTVVSIDTSWLRLQKGAETAEFSVFPQTTTSGATTSPVDAEKELDLSETPRAVRVIQQSSGKTNDGTASQTSVTPDHSQQDIIDFFGKNLPASE